MAKRPRPFVTSRPALDFLYHFIRAYSATFRFTVENERKWMDSLRGGGKVLLCTWHQQFLAAIRHFKSYSGFNPSLMISKSSDGEIIAGVAERTGWRTVRGSSSTDGAKALKAMIENLNRYGLAGHILDGPKGPAGRVKAGVIRLALSTHAAIVPFYTTADRAWYFNSWDTFMLPKPFSRVTLRFGDMINLPAPDHKDDFEARRIELETIMRPGLIVRASRSAPSRG
jgi:hypothetical protein